ncbi:hypothetical protein EIN_110680 [Entamoeba invadens IP1]|uniref:PiggyBac transposable element-derived protein domain-containing protein n=1 Tax=Entamoeba invadens IP1 TaxID=370355 RepID=A0A0A1U3Q3_ENTIV|nr:hypothetical protein EIN_110680 [Entamoeba invadens IP1]ELP86224.1 hypothetical protein EIN_110680 [Entamoeba invadens IP1]|eukprot:XP_004185570.1 hypothetical protein EIN_110680 [Entamoeba invadens IP1]
MNVRIDNVPEVDPVQFQTIQQDRDFTDYFKVFFSDEMKDIIIESTNLAGKVLYEERWKDLNVIELNSFIGFLLYMGVVHDSKKSLNYLYNRIDGNKFYRAIMSKTRFLQIVNSLRFDKFAGERIKKERKKKAMEVDKVYTKKWKRRMRRKVMEITHISELQDEVLNEKLITNTQQWVDIVKATQNSESDSSSEEIEKEDENLVLEDEDENVNEESGLLDEESCVFDNKHYFL